MERTDQTSQRPTPAQNDGTPTNDPDAALHWAAVAVGLAEARTQQGYPLTDTERDSFDRYQAAAHGHGITDEQIRAYTDELNRRAGAA
ncbi:hypothetical protein ACJWDR_28975 [Streptomyces tauricus]|uniref:hypothetical protein n=1 Tax=Streptomyces tauricus TaxID=68274 RepID=UPI00387F21F9